MAGQESVAVPGVGETMGLGMTQNLAPGWKLPPACQRRLGGRCQLITGNGPAGALTGPLTARASTWSAAASTWRPGGIRLGCVVLALPSALAALPRAGVPVSAIAFPPCLRGKP